MKLSYMAVSVLIFSLSVLCFITSLSVSYRAKGKISTLVSDSSVLINTDMKIRDAAENQKLSYLNSKLTASVNLKDSIRKLELNDNVDLVSVRTTEKDNDLILNVKWKYKGRNYETNSKVF